MIALGLHPVAPTGPVSVPNGNRRGTFAATPQGKANASGTPGDPSAKATGTDGTGRAGSGKAGGSGGNTNGIPAGLYVGAGPKSETRTIASAGSRGGGEPAGTTSAAIPTRVTAGRKTATEMPTELETEDERKVFAGRKSYAMTLSVPNLNSSAGSWVMHFSELHDAAKGDLLAPVATHASDPGYPIELMRKNVQGTVTLSAVIHTDGHVGEVKVVTGLDDRLDEYACHALLKWQFLPALKNGEPVPLQAVVIIPFKPTRGRSGF